MPSTNNFRNTNTPQSPSRTGASEHAQKLVPVISDRGDGFEIEDIQFLSEEFSIEEVTGAFSDTQTKIWVGNHPFSALPSTIRDFQTNKMTVYRGDFIRAAFRLPYNGDRVIWEFAVFENAEKTTMLPEKALVEAQSADWDALPDLKTTSQQYIDSNNDKR